MCSTVASPFEKTKPYESEHAGPSHGSDKNTHLKITMDVPPTPRS
jgi:hypothetical protein